MQTVLSLVWERLVPAFGAHAVVATEADERLAARLGSLALPAVGGDASPGQEPGWAGATFFPSGPDPGEGPSLRAVRLYREPTGWVVVLCEEGSELRARLGQGTWAVEERAPAGGHSVPVACSGAWQGPGQLSVDVIFLETPHRLSITCDLAAGTFVARWSSRPVRSTSLAGLGAPGGRH